VNPSRTEVAALASEAVAHLRHSPWELLLLDLNLPVRSGLKVLEESRRLRPKTPVLALSAHAEEEFALRVFKMGAAGYVTRNSAPDELAAALKEVLSGGRYVSASLAERMAASLGGGFQSAPHELLSSRQLQVLQRVATGRTLREIAAELSLSEKTIGTYRARIAEKLRLSTNVELTRYALHHGLA